MAEYTALMLVIPGGWTMEAPVCIEEIRKELSEHGALAITPPDHWYTTPNKLHRLIDDVDALYVWNQNDYIDPPMREYVDYAYNHGVDVYFAEYHNDSQRSCAIAATTPTNAYYSTISNALHRRKTCSSVTVIGYPAELRNIDLVAEQFDRAGVVPYIITDSDERERGTSPDRANMFLSKIALSDAIYVVNGRGYVGSAIESDIKRAKSVKPCIEVFYMRDHNDADPGFEEDVVTPAYAADVLLGKVGDRGMLRSHKKPETTSN